MPRRFRRRLSMRVPDRYFKPVGVPLRDIEEVVITKEDLEALRLRYLKNMNQNNASASMNISQSQYQRDLSETMKKITEALVGGKALRISE